MLGQPDKLSVSNHNMSRTQTRSCINLKLFPTLLFLTFRMLIGMTFYATCRNENRLQLLMRWIVEIFLIGTMIEWVWTKSARSVRYTEVLLQYLFDYILIAFISEGFGVSIRSSHRSLQQLRRHRHMVSYFHISYCLSNINLIFVISDDREFKKDTYLAAKVRKKIAQLEEAAEIRMRLDQKRKEAEMLSRRRRKPAQALQSQQQNLKDFLELRTKLGQATTLKDLVI